MNQDKPLEPSTSPSPPSSPQRSPAEEKAIQVNIARRLSRQHVLKGVVDKDKTTTLDAKTKGKGAKTKLPGWKHFLAGGVAGACEVIGTMPLDVVKTQMQINPGKFRHPIDAIGKIYYSNGIRGLYYGMPAFLLQTSGKAAIRFTAFAKVKESLSYSLGKDFVEKDYKISSNLICGLMAGAVEAAVWTTPTERLKVLRQSDIGASTSSKNQGLLQSGITVVRTGGVSSLFVGLVPCVIRQASSVGIRFMLYDSVKQVVNYVSATGNPEEKVPEGGILTYMAAGGTVGAISVTINNPVDVIKNIAQSGRASGTVHIAKLIYRENGFGGFFRGLSARVPRVFCGQAIQFAAYEKMAEFLLNI